MLVDRRQVEFTYIYQLILSSNSWSKNLGDGKKKTCFNSTIWISNEEVAIDCNLFYHRNVYKGDKPIKCIK